MLRFIAALIAVPPLLTLLLAGAVHLQEGKLASVTPEAFELGLLPFVMAFAIVLVAVFLPLLFVASKFLRVSMPSTVVVGLLSALLPVLFVAWPVLADTTLRSSFKIQRLAESYPWLILGAVGGLVFWLLAIFRNSAFDQRFKKLS